VFSNGIVAFVCINFLFYTFFFKIVTWQLHLYFFVPDNIWVSAIYSMDYPDISNATLCVSITICKFLIIEIFWSNTGSCYLLATVVYERQLAPCIDWFLSAWRRSGSLRGRLHIWRDSLAQETTTTLQWRRKPNNVRYNTLRLPLVENDRINQWYKRKSDN